MSWRAAWYWLAAGSVVCLVRPARAEVTEPVRLAYRAPAGCPDTEQFERQVRRFLPDLELAPESADVRLLEVEIAPEGRRGSLRLQEAGAHGVRQTAGETCEEVAQLLAFAVALAIDPRVQPPDDARPAAASKASASATPPVAIATAPSVAADRSSAREPATSRESLRWGFELHGTAASALAPNMTFGGGGAFEILDVFGSTAMLRVGGSYSTSASVTVDGATVSFVNWLGLLEACPHVWHGGALALTGCLRIDAGVRAAGARNIPAGRTAARPWLALGPFAHGRWYLASSIFVDMGAGLTVPALHDRVYLAPSFTVHDVPWLGFVGELGLGVEFGDRNRN